MRRIAIFLFAALLVVSVAPAQQDVTVRVATYNIKFLDAAKLPTQGDRETKLEEVNQKLGQLRRIQQGLKQLIAACPGQGAVRACSIMDALEDAGVSPET